MVERISSQLWFLQRQFNVSFLFLFLACFAIAPQISAQEAGLSDYRLGSGDLMSIQVFGEDDLSLETRLSDAGTISYPFVGEIKVKGLTTGELSEYITTQLKDGYLINPSVNVSVVEYRQFFINGEVEEPGGFAFLPGLTLQKAVALAGGFTERASKSKITITREKADGTSSVYKGELSSKILPGDIIDIEQSFF
ncbi:MAG: polysaccharide export protein [Cellvibrionaceae bacterium]|nr:polysaccharide export protein [Cellvibrionaceae bacterium]